jgi:high-affinity iron transporter
VFAAGDVAADEGRVSLLAGAVLGLAVAAVIGWVIYMGARRINYATFFRLTGLVLIFIAAGLVADAVHELVEIHVLNFATQPAFDLTAVLPDDAGLGLFLHALFGYAAAPELLAVIAWAAYVVPVLVFYLRPVPVAKPAEIAATALTGSDGIGAR